MGLAKTIQAIAAAEILACSVTTPNHGLPSSRQGPFRGPDGHVSRHVRRLLDRHSALATEVRGGPTGCRTGGGGVRGRVLLSHCRRHAGDVRVSSGHRDVVGVVADVEQDLLDAAELPKQLLDGEAPSLPEIPSAWKELLMACDQRRQ